jgi:hypothetical protein
MSTGEREDKENRWVLTAFGRLSLLTAYLPAYTDRVGFWNEAYCARTQRLIPGIY